MDRATAEQVSLTGIQPCGFRPPGGSYNSTTLSLAQQRRMTAWTWSVDTEDWKANGSSSAYWVNRIISLAEQQGRVLTHPVVLMHDRGRQPGHRPGPAGDHPVLRQPRVHLRGPARPDGARTRAQPRWRGSPVRHRARRDRPASDGELPPWSAGPRQGRPGDPLRPAHRDSPGSSRFEYAPAGVTTGLSVAARVVTRRAPGSRTAWCCALRPGPWQRSSRSRPATWGPRPTGSAVNPDGTGAHLARRHRSLPVGWLRLHLDGLRPLPGLTRMRRQQKSRRVPDRRGPSVMFLVLAATRVMIALSLIRRLLAAGHRLCYLPPW